MRRALIGTGERRRGQVGTVCLVAAAGSASVNVPDPRAPLRWEL
jgi:hypothetical protein